MLIDETDLRERILDANKKMLMAESNIIDSFIAAHNYQMKITGTGLRYEIVKNIKSKKAKPGDEVMIRYKAYLLDGSLCQETDAKLPQVVVLGEARLTKALEEVLLLMDEGDVARIISPSYLAYGMRGDAKLIPATAVLYYELNLMSIKDDKK